VPKRAVSLKSTIHLLIVHSDRSHAAADLNTCRLPIETTVADFDRSILGQIDNSYDVIVLDWELDAPSARGVLDTVCQSAPGTQVLVLSTDVPQEDPVDRGADEFLVEPVSEETLSETGERLALQKAYAESMNDCYRLATERALLQSELESDVDVRERYRAVTQELAECQEHAAAIRAELTTDEFDRALRQLLDK